MDVLQHAPALTAAEAADLGRRLFGIEAEASPLVSERDQNFGEARACSSAWSS